MASQKELESFLKKDSKVNAARKKLDAAGAKLEEAKSTLSKAPAGASAEVVADIKAAVERARAAYEEAKQATATEESRVEEYFNKNYEKIVKKETSTSIKNLEEALKTAPNAQAAESIKASIQDLNDKQNRTGKYAPGASVESGETGGTESSAQGLTVDEVNKRLDTLVKNARAFVYGMKDPEQRKNLAKTLTAAGYPTPELNGEFNDILVNNYKAAIQGAKSWNTQNKKLEGYTPVDLTGFLTYNTRLKNASGGDGTKGISNYIYSPTEAKSTISKVVTSLLNREATDKEVASIAKQLIAAQKANPGRTVNGVTTGRLDAEQFITDIIKSGKEFASKAQAKQDLTTQGIEAVARANGLNLNANELKAYSDRVKNGEDIKTIENQLRAVASLGQPDTIKKLMADGTDLETIYAPYKRTLATSLGLNPESITLDDPTLRMAIGPDKEMSLYDYKKAIRQDSRWKYSEEANNEVSEMINQVKRDFGFMG
jgi:hypothetical protein